MAASASATTTPDDAKPARSGAVRIALVDPLGDFGIGAYTYELAEGLAGNGVSVDVYCSTGAMLAPLALPRRHRVFPVLGTPLIKQTRTLREGMNGRISASEATLERAPNPSLQPPRLPRTRAGIKRLALPVELALLFKLRGYDAVWTQWPTIFSRDARFWRICRALAIPTIHTVHNVLPHEGDTDPAVMRRYRDVYRHATALIVHSEAARHDLVRFTPPSADKTVVSKHGLYTMYPPAARSREATRQRLEIPANRPVAISYGLIRPYKCVENVLEAMRRPGCEEVILIICGREAGYPEPNPPDSDPLWRMRALVRQLGVEDRVRFVPGVLSLQQTSDLMAASDIVTVPYRKAYGSGVLLLALTFGKYVIATPTGGAPEYLAAYPFATVIDSPDPDEIAVGLRAAASAVRKPPQPRRDISQLSWSAIAEQTLVSLERLIPKLHMC
ncbi:MAG: glycosyltransferase [Vicinamibacteraceae bacterium]